jgi:hypothetical protein
MSPLPAAKSSERPAKAVGRPRLSPQRTGIAAISRVSLDDSSIDRIIQFD